MPPGPQPRLASVMDAVVGTPIPTSHTKDMFSLLLTTPAMDSILSSVSPKAVLTAGCCLQTTVPCRGGVSLRKAWGFVTVQDNSIIHLSSKTSTGNTATVLPESAHLFHPPFQSPMAVSQALMILFCSLVSAPSHLPGKLTNTGVTRAEREKSESSTQYQAIWTPQ